MELSVIIPCLNAGDTLGVQLEALASQQWSEPWELIISDNGSTDNSMEIARQYRDRFEAFRIVDASARRGGPYAINTGANAASSDRLACCDADDEVAPGWVASMGEALDKHDVVVGQFHFDKFNDPVLAEKMSKHWKTGLYKGRFLPGGGSGNFGIRRGIHNAIGGFDECLPHAYDADYFWRLQLEGFKIHYVPEAGIQVRVGRVNPSLTYLYRRSRNRAASNYWLYKRYKHLGMLPPPQLKQSLITWVRILKKISFILKNKKQINSWLYQFIEQTGDVVGQIQGRTNNPLTPYNPSKNK